MNRPGAKEQDVPKCKANLFVSTKKIKKGTRVLSLRNFIDHYITHCYTK